MLLKSVKEIRECKTCTRFGKLPSSKPIACGEETAKIIILTQDPNKKSQTLMKKGEKPEFIFTEKNPFAVRISNYLFGNNKYSPLTKDGNKLVNPNFNSDNFCWIHTVNVFCKKESLFKAYKHTRDEHLEKVKRDMLINNKGGILFLIIGSLALSCIKGTRTTNLTKEIKAEGLWKKDSVEYVIGYHPSGSNRVWNKGAKNHNVAQNQVEIIRGKVKKYIK